MRNSTEASLPINEKVPPEQGGTLFDKFLTDDEKITPIQMDGCYYSGGAGGI